jgi:acyl carrier protein phosphodiesterase
MNQYSKMASQVQSRLSRRSAQITTSEMWECGFRSLQRYKDMRETKEVLRELRQQQSLDKALLKLAHAAAAEYAYYHGLDDTLWLEGN